MLHFVNKKICKYNKILTSTTKEIGSLVYDHYTIYITFKSGKENTKAYSNSEVNDKLTCTLQNIEKKQLRPNMVWLDYVNYSFLRIIY